MEHEIALALPPNSHERVRKWLAQQAHTTLVRHTTLFNIYLDTPALDLKRQKAALRLRFDSEQSCWLQTLKTAGKIVQGINARHEWECAIPAVDAQTVDAVPDIALKLFSADAQKFLTPYISELIPVFRTDFRREIYDYLSGNTHFEWAFDDGVVVHMNEMTQTVIHELELEYKSGDLALMRQLAEQAQAALNAQPQYISKAARGYALIRP